MKKTILGAAMAMAFGSVSLAHAAATISFDPDGSGGAGAIAVDNFDWSPGNALVTGIYSNPTNPDGTVTAQVVAQSSLSVFQKVGSSNMSPLAGTEFTFQASFFETATGIGTATAAFSPAAGPSSFNIYYDPTADADPLTGTGYGAGGDAILILSGTLAGLFGNFTDQTILNSVLAPAVLLDQLNADNAHGTLTHQGSGSSTSLINVTFADPNFFLSNVTSLVIDAQDTTTNAIPFSQTEPSDSVLGITPSYTSVNGVRVNGDPNCVSGGQTELGVTSGRCDLHLQTDATTSFNPTAVPEPASMALIGLGLGAFGLVRRRKAHA